MILFLTKGEFLSSLLTLLGIITFTMHSIVIDCPFFVP